MSNYNVEISADNTITVGLPSAGNGVAGPRGEKGYSAYEVAVKNGYTGTEKEWLAYLKGDKGDKGDTGATGATGPAGANGKDGVNGADGKPGSNGLSAYELAVKNGFTGNESAWLESLKGEQGVPGPAGADGKNGVNGVDGKDGMSAYTIAVKNGYNGTESDWINKWVRGTIVSASTDSAGNMALTDINGNSISTPLKPLVDAANMVKAAATSESNAKTSETHAVSSASAAAGSATNAANSASAASAQANTAKNWATATTSPDGVADTASTTGKTQSAKSWALYSKDRATASASSASAASTSAGNAKTSETNAAASKSAAANSATAAATSAGAAKTSETNAASSKTAAATSATNAANSANAAATSATNAANSANAAAASATAAANSANAAAASATAAANSARGQQADWNVTDTSSKAYVKNKPTKWNVLDLAKPLCKNAPLDYTTRPLVDFVRANKLAFLPADQIIIEQTVDGGQTWTDAGFQDAQKENLFNELRTYSLCIPKINGKENAQCGLRVTITAMKYNVPDGVGETDKYNYWRKEYVKSTERYCSIEELYIWCSAASNKIKVKVESATGDDPDNWHTQFSSDSFGLMGEAGGNYIKLGDDYELFGGDISQSFNFWNWRFTFMTTSRNLTDQITARPEVSQSIININGYGSNMWTVPNQLAFHDHLYHWDDKQNATFPANINAKGKLLENGQSITDSIAKQIITKNLTATNATFTGETSVPTANAGNSSKAIANTEFVAKSIAALVNGAPDQLNTLNELAKALGNDSNFAATVTAELAKKLNSAEAESTYATKQEAGVPYQIKRNTPYKVGDVLTSPSLPPGCVIVVTQAGTTGSTEPNWTTIKSNI